jgi:hypothetical protein
MKECLFIPEEIIKDVQKEGLDTKTGTPFTVGEHDGVLLSEEVMSAFVKETGVRVEKIKTEYDGIYQMLGIVLPAKGKTETIDTDDGKAEAAVAGESDSPKVDKFISGPNPGLKTKLNVAIAALQEVVKEIA